MQGKEVGQFPTQFWWSALTQNRPLVRLQVVAPNKSGGLNGSTQHELEVYLQESQQLKSFASVDSNGTLPCLVLIEYSRTDRLSRRKYCRIN